MRDPTMLERGSGGLGYGWDSNTELYFDFNSRT
jgi:hypothetical protein